jgi:outer membrane receptor protein involved in Fe transport
LDDLLGDGSWSEIPGRKNKFDYTEQVIAGYITGSTKLFDAIKTNIGVRAETTIMDFKSILEPDSSFTQNYTLPFPSVYLGYELNVNHQVSANFSSRMRRPNYWDLNPTRNYEDPLNLSKGNPKLKPESHYNFELSYLMNYDKSTLTATLFHRYSTDVIERYREVVNGDTTLSMPRNILTASRSGFELIYMHKIFEYWKADANFSLYSYNIDARNIDAETRTANNWTARINTQLDLMQRFLNITLSANIRSKMLRAQGETEGNWNLDASFRLNFSRQLNVSLRLMDIFNTMQWNSWEEIPGRLKSETNSKYNSRGFVLGFSYRFNDYRQKRERNLDDGRMEEGE